MAFKTYTMNIIFMSLLLQVTLAQVILPENLHRIINDLISQQYNLFSENGQPDFNFDGLLPIPYENYADPQLAYPNPSYVQNVQNEFYNSGFRGFPFGPYVPVNTLRLEPDLALFLAFCNLQPIQVRPNLDCGRPDGDGNQSGVTSTPSEIPSTSNPSGTQSPPVTMQTLFPVSDSTISNSPEQFPLSTSVATNSPPFTNPPTTRPTQPTTQLTTLAATPSTTQPATQSTTTQQPATNQQASSTTSATTEDPSIITIRLGDPDEDVFASTTEEQYLPVNFDVVKPDRVSNITAPPIIHTDKYI